jgi:hypothetical protein
MQNALKRLKENCVTISWFTGSAERVRATTYKRALMIYSANCIFASCLLMYDFARSFHVLH